MFNNFKVITQAEYNEHIRVFRQMPQKDVYTLLQVADRKLFALDEELDRKGIKYFSACELTRQRNWRRARVFKYGFPHDKDWENIFSTVKFIDNIRKKWNVAIIVISAMRVLRYNHYVGSKDTSCHVRFRAMDITFYKNKKLWLEFVRWMKCFWEQDSFAKELKMGLGFYKWFCHIDTGYRKRKWNW